MQHLTYMQAVLHGHVQHVGQQQVTLTDAQPSKAQQLRLCTGQKRVRGRAFVQHVDV